LKLNKKNKITIVLLTATLFLWGGILYNIILYFTSQEEKEPEVIVENSGLNLKHIREADKMDENILYKEISRDPFVFRIKEPVIEEALPVNTPPQPKLQYSIAGTIITSTNKLVVFEDRSNNKTLFLREGDEYNGIKITSVSGDHIKIMEDKKLIEINSFK
jgi:hypothetical protein